MPNENKALTITFPTQNAVLQKEERITVSINYTSGYPLTHVQYFVNNVSIGDSTNSPFTFSFSPNGVSSINLNGTNTLVAISTDSTGQQNRAVITFTVQQLV